MLESRHWFSLLVRKVIIIVNYYFDIGVKSTSSIRELQSSSVARSRASDPCDGARFWSFHLCSAKTPTVNLCFITVRVRFLNTNELSIFRDVPGRINHDKWLIPAYLLKIFRTSGWCSPRLLIYSFAAFLGTYSILKGLLMVVKP